MVTDPMQGLQEAGQVDDAFAGQQALVIADLFRRQIWGVIEMDVHDAVAAGRDDVLGGRPGVVPVPGIEKQTDVGTAFLGEGELIVHAPDEFVFVCFAKFKWAEKLEAEADVVAR